jgi:SSS family solute:Na+ symporter
MNGIIIGIFFAGMIFIGILSARKIKDASSYFVADRSGGGLVITGSLLATTLGGSSTMGLAGLGYSKGLVGAWWLLVGAIGFLILSLWLAEKVRAYSLYTLPEILEKQYGGTSIKIVASLLIATAWLGIIAAQIIAAGKILSVIWPGHMDTLITIAGIITILYTFLGGQHSILKTDFIQSIIIIAGIAICAFMGVSASGGFSEMVEKLPSSYFSFPTSPTFTAVDLLTFLFFVGATYLVGPDIYSRIFCSRDTKVAKRSVATAAIIMIPTAFLITFIGISARLLLPGIQPESAFPAIIMHIAPVGLNGLIMAALLAAVMSSADTCLLTTATIIVADIIHPFSKRKINEKSFLRMSRIGVIVVGLISLLIALKIKGIIASLLLGYTIYCGGLVIPVLMGFHKNELGLNTCGAISSIVGGGGLALFLKLSGNDDMLLVTIPVSAILLFTGSYAKRILYRQ